MVDDDFTVDDVEKLVGGDRVSQNQREGNGYDLSSLTSYYSLLQMITVVVVATQQSEDMPLKKFIEFYKNVDGRQSKYLPFQSK